MKYGYMRNDITDVKTMLEREADLVLIENSITDDKVFNEVLMKAKEDDIIVIPTIMDLDTNPVEMTKKYMALWIAGIDVKILDMDDLSTVGKNDLQVLALVNIVGEMTQKALVKTIKHMKDMGLCECPACKKEKENKSRRFEGFEVKSNVPEEQIIDKLEMVLEALKNGKGGNINFN